MQTIDSIYNPSRLFLVPERRSLNSELELAADTLGNAVHYLVTEQRIDRRVSMQANRDAIGILCEAAREIAQQERRSAARKSVASLLKLAAA